VKITGTCGTDPRCPADLLLWYEVLFTRRLAVVQNCAPFDHADYQLLIVILLYTKNKHLPQFHTSSKFYDSQDYEKLVAFIYNLYSSLLDNQCSATPNFNKGL
jgi:hypothetical protein